VFFFDRKLNALRAAVSALTEEIHRLEACVGDRDRIVARQTVELERERELVAKLERGIQQVKGDVERINESRSWRFGHRAAVMVDKLLLRRRLTEGAVVRALERLQALEAASTKQIEAAPAKHLELKPAGELAPAKQIESAPADRSGLEPAEKSALARQIRRRLGSPPRRRSWPLVSLVVLNRNGEAHLHRLLEGLEHHTDYPDFELIVVDNASVDGSVSYLRSVRVPFPLRLVESSTNLSFSEGNNVGAAHAEGPLLLFLNNDIEPFEKGWMRELVVLASHSGVGAVGATLLHATQLDQGVPRVQHRGIRMRRQEGGLRPFNLDDGGTVFSDKFGIDLECPATTGACLMITADRYAAISGFPMGYRYGSEDVDLGLQLVDAGYSVVTSGRSYLLHRESSTQNAEGRVFMRDNRLVNQRLFAERWGSRLRREYRVERLRGGAFWSEGDSPHAAVTLTSLEQAAGHGDWYTGHELGDALAALGWRVTYVQRKKDEWYQLPEDLDYLVVLLDSYDLARVDTPALKVAWVRNWTDRWIARNGLDGYDLVLASSDRSAKLIEAETGIRAELFPLATNPGRFSVQPVEPALAADLTFPGNRWDRARAIEAFEPAAEHSLKVFGLGWDEVPQLAPHIHGAIAYAELPAVYSSAKLVIDDAAEHTLPYGSVNSRVFDALACGTVVVTNGEAGARELFDEDFPVWHDGPSLRAVVDELLADDAGRRRLADRYRRVVLDRHTYAVRARRLVELLAEVESRLSFVIKVGAPNQAVAAEWGDVHFGEALARELRRRGHRATVQTLDGWDALTGLGFDVAIHLKGLSSYVPKPGQVNVLWCISHPELVTVEECESYDLVCIASERFAASLRRRVSKPVVVLEQATDPRLFFPDPDSDQSYRHELLFVANSRKVRRRILADLLPTEHDLAVYGTNWAGLIDPRHIAGEHIANKALRTAYSSASIVLNDHWDDMREHGFISNRIYDVLACEGLVLSDHLPELTERFGEAVVTYTDPEELPELIERLLADPDERARRGRQGRALVLESHTFAHRVDQLLTLLGERVGETRLIREPTPAKPSPPAARPASRKPQLAGVANDR